jgi:hypothetical protein
MFPSKIGSLIAVSSLSAHGYGGLQVKFQIVWRFDEFFELLNIFQLRIAVKKECGMVGRCLVVIVQLFQVVNQIMNPMGIKKLLRLASAEQN